MLVKIDRHRALYFLKSTILINICPIHILHTYIYIYIYTYLMAILRGTPRPRWGGTGRPVATAPVGPRPLRKLRASAGWDFSKYLSINLSKNKMKLTNPNAHTYVNGTDVKHMVMQWRTIPFCNRLFEQSCACLPCYQSAVWSGKCRVWSVECQVWSVECKVWSGECRVCKV